MECAEFIQTSSKLLDIFCHDTKQRKLTEKEHKLLMSQCDYDFYNDQTLNRKMVCTCDEVQPTEKDKRFKKDILHKELADFKVQMENHLIIK